MAWLYHVNAVDFVVIIIIITITMVIIIIIIIIVVIIVVSPQLIYLSLCSSYV
jgi:hypothetical protein